MKRRRAGRGGGGGTEGRVLQLGLLLAAVRACPDRCSGHGDCGAYNLCQCWSSWQGPSCAERKCPYSTAWFDVPQYTPTANLTEDMSTNYEGSVGRFTVSAHDKAECGNKGRCNRQTGDCECDAPWTGSGCQRMGCSNDCSDHGECVSMAYAATNFDGFLLNHTTTYTEWDADLSMGCVCDMGYEGYDCSQARFHRGPNPLEITTAAQPEVVKLYCKCDPEFCGTQTLTLSFDGGKTRPISPYVTNATLHKILTEDIDTILGSSNRYVLNPTKALLVEMERSSAPNGLEAHTLCSTYGSTTNITFLANEGDVPAMMVTMGNDTTNSYDVATTDVHFITEQTLTCDCSADCQGTFQLEFDGLRTRAVPFSATADDIRNALVGLKTLSYDQGVDGFVSVGNIKGATASTAMCVSGEARTVDIVLTHKIGNLPRIAPLPSLGFKSNVGGSTMSVSSNDGSSTASICNGQGFANANTVNGSSSGANCSCTPGFEAGEFGDCGSIAYHSSNWAGLERCPGTIYNDGTPVPVHHVIDTAPLVYFMDNGANKSMYTRTRSGFYTLSTGTCPSVVTSATACESGANALGFTYVSARNYGSSLPDGCYVVSSSGEAYYNTGGANNCAVAGAGTVCLCFDTTPRIEKGTDRALPGIASFNAKDMSRIDDSPFIDIHRNLTNGTQAGAALDMSTQRLYFVDHSIGGIRSMSVNGSDVLSLSWKVGGLYSDFGDPGVLRRPGYTGSDMRTFVANGVGGFAGSDSLDQLALDLRPNKRFMYFTDPGQPGEYDGAIYAVNLDGEPTVVSLASKIGQTKLRDPKGIAVDLKRDFLYWVDGAGNFTMAQRFGPGQLWRCDLDGLASGKNPTLVYGNFTSPQGLALNLDNWTAFITDVGTMPNPAVWQVGMDWHLDNRAVMGFAHGYAWEFKNVSGPHKMQDTIQLDTFGGEFQKVFPMSFPYDIALDYVDQRYYLSDPDLGIVGWGPMMCVTCELDIDGLKGNPIDFYSNRDYVIGLHFGGYGRYRSSPVGLALDLRGGYPRSGFLDCWGHGDCLEQDSGHDTDADNSYKCVCYDGWFGSCQMGECPKGSAWWDEAFAPNAAHEPVECSNMGYCDRATAKCQCHEGFSGAACERTECPTAVAGAECSGHGTCVSMREAAAASVDALGDPSPLHYGAYYNYTNSSTWEADKIFGCQCDEMGYMIGGQLHNYSMWTGYDCSEQMCPHGDYMGRFATTVWEKQTLRCQTNLDGGGSFQLSFRGQLTRDILFNASVDTLQERLEALSNIGTVSITADYRYHKLCWPLGEYDNVITIEFTSELGDLPLLVPRMQNLNGNITVKEAVKGNKTSYECSLHGKCNRQTGECECDSGWTSSNGDAKAGLRGDCGFPETVSAGVGHNYVPSQIGVH